MRSIALTAVVLTLLHAPVAATTVWVDDDCAGPGAGTESEPYCTIQEAVCQLHAAGGGTVLVEPGVYNESLRMFPGVSVVSTGGAAVTTLDATGRGCTSGQCEVYPPDSANRCAAVVWGSGSTNADRLEGLRITGGAGLGREFGDGNAQVGGGIFVFNSSPTISRNVIADNVLFSKSSHNFWGGGIYLGGGSYATPTYPVITYNVIEGNSATPTLGDVSDTVVGSEAVGGGIYVGLYTAPTIENNVIRNNVAAGPFTELGVGGGIAVYSIAPSRAPVISRNVIAGNTSNDHGGGLFFGQVFDGYTPLATRARVESNVIENNRSASGGGVLTNTTVVELYANTIVDNAADLGGGMALYESTSNEPVVVDNVVAYNVGLDGGGGIAFFTSPDVVVNNDVFGNLPDQIGGEWTDLDFVGIDGNASVAPQFNVRSPAGRDLTPVPGSPLVDGGSLATLGPFDLKGRARRLDGDGDGIARADLGAIEYAPDAASEASGSWVGDCPAAINVTSADLDGDGLGDPCDVCPSSPDNDRDGDGVCEGSDLCPDIPDPAQSDLDADGIGDACDPDDDGDGVDDAEDAFPDDRLACGDTDGDTCDDCSGGAKDASADGIDFDADGLCDAGDPDDDDDGVPDPVDSHPLDPLRCADSDADACDDCARGTGDPADDGTDLDMDGLCDLGDPDDDGDGVLDEADAAPDDPTRCSDVDADGCDDCSGGAFGPATDGPDFDGDGRCDDGDPDDDNDGTLDDVDCAALAPGVTTAPPALAPTLRFAANDALTWRRGPQAMTYNVYRGERAADTAFAWEMQCAVAETLSAHADAPDVPSPGALHFYVVVPRNVCGDAPVRADDRPAPFATDVCPVGDADADGDGLLDLADNCPELAGADPRDSDADGRGDRCDACPYGERPDGRCLDRTGGRERAPTTREDGTPAEIEQRPNK